MPYIRILDDTPLPTATWDTVWTTVPTSGDFGSGNYAIADPELEPNNIGGLRSRTPVETAILLCLFTSREDWHGNSFDIDHEAGERILGSDLEEKLKRAPLNEQTLREARHYAAASLQTLIDQKVVSSFEIEAGFSGNQIQMWVKAIHETQELYSGMYSFPMY